MIKFTREKKVNEMMMKKIEKFCFHCFLVNKKCHALFFYVIFLPKNNTKQQQKNFKNQTIS